MTAEFSRVVERIYAAAVDPEAWPAALHAVAAALGGTACGIRVEALDVPAVSQTWVGLEPDFERAYVERYWSDDIWAQEGRRGAPGLARASDQMVETAIRRGNPFINELCVPFELDDLVGGLISLTPRRMVSFAAMKARGHRPFDAKDAELVGLLIPHIRRALAVDHALTDARQSEGMAWGAVERLPVGVFVLDERRAVVHMNAAGERMVAEGLVLDSRAVRETITTGRPRAVTTTKGKILAAVTVPVRAEQTLFSLASERGRTLLVVTDPSARVLPPAELLTRIYGLTAAEARVALLVGRGLAPKEAAEQLGSAWNTVRAQLRQVFAKTQTSSQSGLVRLLVLLGLTHA